MNKQQCFCIVFLLLLSLGYQVQAQDNFWQLQIEGEKLITPVILHKLDGDTLFYNHLRLNPKVDIMKIEEIRFVRDGSFWRGAEKGMWIGSSIGLAYGLIQNLATRPKGGSFGSFYRFSKEPYNVTFAIANAIVDAILGLTIGGLLGGIIDISINSDTVYDLADLNNLGRKTNISAILKSNL